MGLSFGMTREPLTLAPPETRPAPRPSPPRGDWKYDSPLRSRKLYAVAVFVATGLHALVLFGFNRHAQPVRHVTEDDAITVKFVMPDLKELEEPDHSADSADTPEAGSFAPTLPDVPSYVDLPSAFVQQIDYRSLVPQPDLSNAKTITIPAVISRGGRLGEGMKNLFNLADLDRAPVPLVQVKPVMPAALKRQGGSAEVQVAFIVNTEGRVVGPVAISGTDPECENAAVMAVAKWKFRPGIKGGRRVNVRMMQPIIFTVTAED